MPLTHHGRLVTSLLQLFCDIVPVRVDRIVERVDAVLIAVLPG